MMNLGFIFGVGISVRNRGEGVGKCFLTGFFTTFVEYSGQCYIHQKGIGTSLNKGFV